MENAKDLMKGIRGKIEIVIIHLIIHQQFHLLSDVTLSSSFLPISSLSSSPVQSLSHLHPSKVFSLEYIGIDHTIIIFVSNKRQIPHSN